VPVHLRRGRFALVAMHLRRGRLALVGALCVTLAVCPNTAAAHDASSWGGLFRSRDGGATWFQANQGRLVAGALAIAVDPSDANHLLLGTDAGLLTSRNGGLDWQAALGLPGTAVLAVAFDRDGRRQLASSDVGVFTSDDGAAWRAAAVPAGGVPARALVVGRRVGEVYLLGPRGMFHSDDWSATWTTLATGLPREPVLGLAVVDERSLVCLASGQPWLSDDAGQSWRAGPGVLPAGQLQMLSADQTGVWTAGADRLFHSDDGGRTWRNVGQPLPDAHTDIRGVVASADAARILVSTHRGAYTTTDGGATWSAVTDNLPGHIEAGPLVRDPVDARTVYIGFALTPYDEQWRRALDGGSAATRLGTADVVGAAAFLLLLAFGSGLALQWLARRREPRAVTAIPP
jgi:photosystem II stability/assembly factor-like uncharacterized protein